MSGCGGFVASGSDRGHAAQPRCGDRQHPAGKHVQALCINQCDRWKLPTFALPCPFTYKLRCEPCASLEYDGLHSKAANQAVGKSLMTCPPACICKRPSCIPHRTWAYLCSQAQDKNLKRPQCRARMCSSFAKDSSIRRCAQGFIREFFDQNPFPMEIGIQGAARCAQGFIREFFDQNPLSHLGLIVLRNGVAEKLTDLSGSPARCPPR